MKARNTVTNMQTNRQILRRQLVAQMPQFERSLCRKCFRGHKFNICKNHRQKTDQNPRATQMAYAIV